MYRSVDCTPHSGVRTAFKQLQTSTESLPTRCGEQIVRDRSYSETELPTVRRRAEEIATRNSSICSRGIGKGVTWLALPGPVVTPIRGPSLS